MERIQIDLTEKQLEIIKKFQKQGEDYAETVKRIILTYVPRIDPEVWTKNMNHIFDEFEETFTKLAE
ncbi:MAG: hypothetical protein INQ03_24720 [Candidatus Heimdallarchaeota archaeon]|nr:hypothetical protein [Candidatus Heimdallarchaeota archaeon]